MAVRLPVVLCQHERRSGGFTDLEEQWITSLLFSERLDATLIASLSQIEKDSTDHLCLEGLKGDFVLISWDSKKLAMDNMLRLGMDSVELIPLDGSGRLQGPTPASSNLKKVYFLQFDLQQSAEKGISQVKILLDSLSTPVFQLNGSLPLRKMSEPPHTAMAEPLAEPMVKTWENSAGNSHTDSVKIHTAEDSSRHSNIDGEFPNIDSLVRELDDFE